MADMRNRNNQTVRDYLANHGRQDLRGISRTLTEGRTEIMSIPVHKLNKSYYSQRGINKRLAEKIAKDFDPNLFSPIIVSYRDGKWYVIDGQHRLYGVKKRFGDDYLVDCKVIRGLTQQEEAGLFVKLNTSSRRLQYADVAKGLYYANDETMTDIFDICKSHGVELGIDDDKHSSADGRITAIKAIVDTYNKIGAKQTDRLVKLLNDTWDGKSSAFKQEMIKATGVILSLYSKELDDERFVKKFSKIDPRELISVARNDDATKTKTENKLARIMIQNYYNRGKGAKPLEYRFGF